MVCWRGSPQAALTTTPHDLAHHSGHLRVPRGGIKRAEVSDRAGSATGFRSQRRWDVTDLSSAKPAGLWSWPRAAQGWFGYTRLHSHLLPFLFSKHYQPLKCPFWAFLRSSAQLLALREAPLCHSSRALPLSSCADVTRAGLMLTHLGSGRTDLKGMKSSTRPPSKAASGLQSAFWSHASQSCSLSKVRCLQRPKGTSRSVILIWGRESRKNWSYTDAVKECELLSLQHNKSE